MNQVLYALHHLHTEEKIVHKFITPESIGLKRTGQISQIILYHFGCATQLNDDDENATVELSEVEKTFVTDAKYGMERMFVAPESRRQLISGYKSDIWSCGMILFLLLSGYFPFENVEDLDTNYYEHHFDSIKIISITDYLYSDSMAVNI